MSELVDKLLNDAELCLMSCMTDIRLPDIGRRILELIEVVADAELRSLPEYRVATSDYSVTTLPLRSLDQARLRMAEIAPGCDDRLFIESRPVVRGAWVRL